MERFQPLLWPLAAALTLGLAPIAPEPHLVEKLRWLATGHPFAPIDVFDVFMHGAPWVWLAVALVQVLRTPAGSAPTKPS
jgi:hypothetical protein